MLIDACDGECIDKSYVIKTIAEEIPEVQKAHVVRLRQSGPILQGEMEIKVSPDLTVKEFTKIKKEIKKKIERKFPDIQRLTITAFEEDLE